MEQFNSKKPLRNGFVTSTAVAACHQTPAKKLIAASCLIREQHLSTRRSLSLNLINIIRWRHSQSQQKIQKISEIRGVPTLIKTTASFPQIFPGMKISRVMISLLENGPVERLVTSATDGARTPPSWWMYLVRSHTSSDHPSLCHLFYSWGHANPRPGLSWILGLRLFPLFVSFRRATFLFCRRFHGIKGSQKKFMKSTTSRLLRYKTSCSITRVG